MVDIMYFVITKNGVPSESHFYTSFMYLREDLYELREQEPNNVYDYIKLKVVL